MKIAVTPKAAGLIRRCGGKLYIWGSEGASELICSTIAPEGMQFRRYSQRDFEVFVEASMKASWNELEVTLKRFPRTLIHVAPR